MNENEMIEWIKKASYEELLRKWRFAPIASEIFQGELGKFYSDTMFKKKALLTHDEAVQASKNIGWG